MGYRRESLPEFFLKDMAVILQPLFAKTTGRLCVVAFLYSYQALALNAVGTTNNAAVDSFFAKQVIFLTAYDVPKPRALRYCN